jgi:hypothetical protein
VPDAPTNAATVLVLPDKELVTITWSTPYDGGTPLLGYKIAIRHGDQINYDLELVNCDGFDATIFAENTCTVTVADLKAAPFEVPWGDGVYVKVLANNVLGDGPYSEAGNGAVIVTTPFAPQQLEEVPSITNKN